MPSKPLFLPAQRPQGVLWPWVLAIVTIALCMALARPGCAQPSPPPGVRQSGAVVANDCVKWVSNNLIADAGAACGSGGGSVSVTGADGLVVVSPSPGTGTFTVGVNHDAATGGNCVTWSTSTKLGDFGGPCGGGAAPFVDYTFSGSTLNPFAFGTCFRSAAAVTNTTNGQRLRISAQVYKANTFTTQGIGIFNTSNATGYAILWQNSTPILERFDAAGLGAIASGSAGLPLGANYYNFTLTITTNTVDGQLITGAIEGNNTFGLFKDNTYNLTSGTWVVCAYAGGTGDIIQASTRLGSQP